MTPVPILFGARVAAVSLQDGWCLGKRRAAHELRGAGAGQWWEGPQRPTRRSVQRLVIAVDERGRAVQAS